MLIERMPALETHGPAGIHHIAGNAATHVFMVGNGTQRFARHGVCYFARKHLAADIFLFIANAFQLIGRVFGVNVKQFARHFLDIFNSPGFGARRSCGLSLSAPDAAQGIKSYRPGQASKEFSWGQVGEITALQR